MKITDFVPLLFSLSIFSMSTVVIAEGTEFTELKRLLVPISTLQANFEQTVKNEKGNLLQKLSGKVVLKKPAQFRWEVITPEPRLVVSDGQKVWDYDKELEQVAVQKLTRGQSRAPIYFLTGDVNTLDKDFKISFVSSKQGKCLKESDACFELTPKRGEGSFQWIRIGFRNKNLKEMQMLDQLDQYSQFIFQDVQLNGNVSVSQFRFIPPRNVDVLVND